MEVRERTAFYAAVTSRGHCVYTSFAEVTPKGFPKLTVCERDGVALWSQVTGDNVHFIQADASPDDLVRVIGCGGEQLHARFMGAGVDVALPLAFGQNGALIQWEDGAWSVVLMQGRDLSRGIELNGQAYLRLRVNDAGDVLENELLHVEDLFPHGTSQGALGFVPGVPTSSRVAIRFTDPNRVVTIDGLPLRLASIADEGEARLWFGQSGSKTGNPPEQLTLASVLENVVGLSTITLAEWYEPRVVVRVDAAGAGDLLMCWRELNRVVRFASIARDDMAPPYIGTHPIPALEVPAVGRAFVLACFAFEDVPLHMAPGNAVLPIRPSPTYLANCIAGKVPIIATTDDEPKVPTENLLMIWAGEDPGTGTSAEAAFEFAAPIAARRRRPRLCYQDSFGFRDSALERVGRQFDRLAPQWYLNHDEDLADFTGRIVGETRRLAEKGFRLMPVIGVSDRGDGKHAIAEGILAEVIRRGFQIARDWPVIDGLVPFAAGRKSGTTTYPILVKFLELGLAGVPGKALPHLPGGNVSASLTIKSYTPDHGPAPLVVHVEADLLEGRFDRLSWQWREVGAAAWQEAANLPASTRATEIVFAREGRFELRLVGTGPDGEASTGKQRLVTVEAAAPAPGGNLRAELGEIRAELLRALGRVERLMS